MENEYMDIYIDIERKDGMTDALMYTDNVPEIEQFMLGIGINKNERKMITPKIIKDLKEKIELTAVILEDIVSGPKTTEAFEKALVKYNDILFQLVKTIETIEKTRDVGEKLFYTSVYPDEQYRVA